MRNSPSKATPRTSRIIRSALPTFRESISTPLAVNFRFIDSAISLREDETTGHKFFVNSDQ